MLAVLGAWVAGDLDDDTLSRIFGVVVLYVGGRTLYTVGRRWRRERAEVQAAAEPGGAPAGGTGGG